MERCKFCGYVLCFWERKLDTPEGRVHKSCQLKEDERLKKEKRNTKEKEKREKKKLHSQNSNQGESDTSEKTEENLSTMEAHNSPSSLSISSQAGLGGSDGFVQDHSQEGSIPSLPVNSQSIKGELQRSETVKSESTPDASNSQNKEELK